MSRVQDRVHTGQETHDGDNKREVAMFTSVIEAMMLSKNVFFTIFNTNTSRDGDDGDGGKHAKEAGG